MNSRFHALLTVVAYTTIILGTMYWSGKGREKTVYDSYLVNVEAVELSSSNLARSELFYRTALNFQTLSSDKTPHAVAFQLPDQRKLRLQTQPATGRSGLVEFRVRNGFPKLYNHLKDQFSQFQRLSTPDLGASSISTISIGGNGREFSLVDPDGNRVVFVSPLRNRLGRPHK